MAQPLVVNTTRATRVRSELERFWEPARRFVRAQSVQMIQDTDLEPDELLMRNLIMNTMNPTIYPPCTDKRIIRVYDIHMFHTLKEMLLCLLISGNTPTEVSEKSRLSVEDINLFTYFFCNEDFLDLPKSTKTAVLSSPDTFHTGMGLIPAVVNWPKLVVDIHFNLMPKNVKEHAGLMRELTLAHQFYLANKDAHYVKPGQKSFAAVMDAMDRSNQNLKELAGGDRSNTIELVMKSIEEIKGAKEVVPVETLEDLNVDKIDTSPKNEEPA